MPKKLYEYLVTIVPTSPLLLFTKKARNAMIDCVRPKHCGLQERHISH